MLKRCVAEALGTGFLVVAVVGSGIMAERLSGGNGALALLANAIATGGILFCLIAALAPISGAHLNPAVSLCDACLGGLRWRELPAYVSAQTLGAVAGTACANAMFGLPLLFVSHRVRAGSNVAFAEFVATFGLLFIIWGTWRYKSSYVPFAVSAYITAAYWFTSSTSFANPAVTIARAFSDTFAGIRLADVPVFVVAEILGALAATATFAWLAPVARET